MGLFHAAAGRGLLEECALYFLNLVLSLITIFTLYIGRGLNGCETGESKITKGYKLPSSVTSALPQHFVTSHLQKTHHTYRWTDILFEG